MEVDLGQNIYSRLEYGHTDDKNLDYRDGSFSARARLNRDAVLYGFDIRF